MIESDGLDLCPRKIEKTLPLCPVCDEIPHAKMTGAEAHQTVIDRDSDLLRACYHDESDTLWLHIRESYIYEVLSRSEGSA